MKYLRNPLSPLALGASILVLAAVIYPAATFIPVDGFFAFDWVHFFGIGRIPPFYPPWAIYAVKWINYPALIALTMAAAGVASYQRARHPVSFAMVFLSLPVLWTVFLGQTDGLALLGVIGLPLLAPLALVKPQIAIWAFGARKSYLVAFLITLMLSFLFFGFWPAQMFSVWTVHAEGRYVNDIALGLWGIPIALVLFWFSRGDPDMLMLAGCCATPYLLPYNLILVAPAIARLHPLAAILACALSWMPFSANWLGPAGWFAGWLFIGWVWGCLAWRRYRTPEGMTHEEVFSRSEDVSVHAEG